MNLIQRLHDHGQPHTHGEGHARGQSVPFWVRHYDTIVSLITLGRGRAIHRQTLALAGLRSGDSVLDIGCGTGMLALEAERMVGPQGTVAGLDVEAAMVEQAKRRADRQASQVSFEVASIERIPYPDDTFDVVFSTLMLHHLSETARDLGFREVVRVLKPGGRFVLVDINPSRRSILTSLPGHRRLESEDTVRVEGTARMRDAGLRVLEDGPHPSKQLSFATGEKA